MLRNNQAALSIANKNPTQHYQTERIEIDHHFISEKIQSTTISMEYIPIWQQVTNILTKPLHQAIFNEL